MKQKKTTNVQKTKDINENVADDETKSEDYKNVLLKRSYMIHEISRIQKKDHIIRAYIIN